MLFIYLYINLVYSQILFLFVEFVQIRFIYLQNIFVSLQIFFGICGRCYTFFLHL